MIVGLTGYAQSGKDTAASFLVELGWRRFAFADILRTSLYALNPIADCGCWFEDDAHLDGSGGCDPETERVQEIVDRIGWDRAKVEYPEIRQLLQRLGTEVGRELFGENFWVERVMDQVSPFAHDYDGSNVVITDVRFKNEEVAVHGAGGKVFRIVRPNVGAANQHASELEIDKLFVDGTIPNLGNLDQFRVEVLAAVGLN